MSYSGTTYGDISPRVGIQAVAEMLAYAQNVLVLDKFAKSAVFQKNKGLIMRWRRPVPFDVVDTALTEGVTPAPQILEYEDIETTIQQYGSWIQFTDVIQDTHEDPNLKVMTELCGQQAAATKEAILWGVLTSGTNVFYSGTATSRATVSAPLAYEDIVAVVRELKANVATKITSVIRPGSGEASEPVQPAFVAFTHTDCENDIRNLDGFISTEKYASSNMLCPEEIGSVGQVRFIVSPQLTPFYGAGSSTITGVMNNGTNVDVYATVIVGKDAYASVALAGRDSVSMAVTNPKMGTPGDELGQRGSVSWKFWYSAKILNDSWMVRIEHAVNAL